MFPMKRRWPVMTGLVAALAYGASNYEIDGLQHLRLIAKPQTEQRAPSPQSSIGYDIYGNPTSNQPAGGFDWTQYGIQTQNSSAGFADDFYGAARDAASQAFKVDLQQSEKMTLLENRFRDGLQSASEWAGTVSQAPSLPATAPIAAPDGYALGPANFSPPPLLPATGGLPSTSPSQYTGLPAHDMAAAGYARSGADMTPLPGLPTSRTGGTTAAGPVAPPPAAFPGDTAAGNSALPSNNSPRIRVASFNVESMGPAKLAKPHVVETLVRILRQYDVIALQEIRSERDDILPLLVERLNQSGRTYDYMVGPRVGRTAPHDQFAFVFDTSRLETDRYQLYTIDDPQDLVTFEPLVAWFRCKGLPQHQAFTFSLISVRIDPNFAARERNILPGLIEAVERDGRREDDWILVGDFAGGVSELRDLDNGTNRFAIRDIPTDITGERMLSGVIFSGRATTEFTGRAGAFDFLRKYNLSIEQAHEVSRHLPVWAEFSASEGAEPGRVAPVDPNQVY